MALLTVDAKGVVPIHDPAVPSSSRDSSTRLRSGRVRKRPDRTFFLNIVRDENVDVDKRVGRFYVT